MRKRHWIKSVLAILFVGLSMTNANAFHIIGGEVTYTCLGQGSALGINRYQFDMYIYRDCMAGEQMAAPLDPVAPVAIWRRNNASYTMVMQLSVALQNVQEIDQPVIECLIPPDNLCVERGYYTWTIELPTISQSYHVTYQRCCRNSTISNINNPNQSGATYSMEMRAMAQSGCNNSPTFKEFPPTIICVNEPVSFDHSAIDSDGDSLVYSFVAPLLGGDSSPQGARPSGGPPPYAAVSFRLPIYSTQEPLGGEDRGDPAVSIDPITGEITGVPKTAGQFVVGVRVLEYRDGFVIGELKRDFQFNVANCESLVNASLQADETIGFQAYALTSCGQQTVSFVNTSTVQSQIFSYEWEFMDNIGGLLTSTVRNATIAFPDTGTYLGNMYLNRGSICEDSASIAVRILPETTADYTFDYDTCVVGPVAFTDMSSTESERIVSYVWDFGGTGMSTELSPIYNFPEPSTQPVTLTVTDINGCESVSTQNVIWLPAPQTVIVQPNTFLGCEPADISFINLSSPIDDTYTFNWDFGDGNTSNELSPSHIYESSGVYDISLEIISPIGCQVEGTFNSLIRVEQGPAADFDFTPKELSSLNRRVQFVDQSTDAASWFWNFSDEKFSAIEDPIHTFQDTGIQIVRLIVTKANGCQDTITKELDIVPEVLFHMPNAFTPNNDGSNETFFGKGVLIGMRDFQLAIWNRWGEQIFVTTDPTEGWNGRKNNVGANSPIGSYPYLVTFREPRGALVRIKGNANLIR